MERVWDLDGEEVKSMSNLFLRGMRLSCAAIGWAGAPEELERGQQPSGIL